MSSLAHSSLSMKKQYLNSHPYGRWGVLQPPSDQLRDMSAFPAWGHVTRACSRVFLTRQECALHLSVVKSSCYSVGVHLRHGSQQLRSLAEGNLKLSCNFRRWVCSPGCHARRGRGGPSSARSAFTPVLLHLSRYEMAPTQPRHDGMIMLLLRLAVVM